jgi:DNA-binding response OmpR family regulator
MTELKILICDDDPALQGLLQRRLEKMGITPDIAGDGRKALNLVEENNYDVIVADIYMPEASGLEVLQFAKQKDSDTQVVIITSSATLDNAIDALNHGAFGYLTKPFDHLIVFDNMVSRAAEYRHLLVAERRKAEAQKRRGDMLEDEVTERVQQLQKKQKGLLDLLGSLPDGVLVVEEGGQVVLSSPVGERWMEQDRQSDTQPIHAFISQIHSEMAETNAQVQLGEYKLQLMAVDFPHEGQARRRAVIVREADEVSIGAGSMVTDTVMGIKKGLATLYEQGVGTEVVLNLANQFAVLEQLSGWSGGTGDLARGEVSRAEAPKATPVVDAQVAAPDPEPAEPIQTDHEQQILDPPAEDPLPTEVKSVPPFTIPRERVPTGELDEPRLSTGELAEALRGAGAEPADETPTQAPESETVLADAETIVSAPAPSLDSDTEPAPHELPTKVLHPVEAEAPDLAAEITDSPQQPTPSWMDGIAEIPDEAPADIPPESEPVHEVASETELVEPSPEEMEPRPESGAEPNQELEPQSAVAAEDVEPEPPASGLLGRKDRPLEEASLYSPRVIPEEMDAKLETPAELPGNGRVGPLKVQTKLADTQVFRKVLAGLSGSEVEGMTGEKVGPPKRKPKAEAKADEQPEAQPAPEPDVEPEPEAVDEQQQEASSEPTAVAPEPAEPEAEPVAMKAGAWPPKKPSEDDQWDDTLDLSD